MRQQFRNNRREATVVGSNFRDDDLQGFNVYRNVELTLSLAFVCSFRVCKPSIRPHRKPSVYNVNHNVKRNAHFLSNEEGKHIPPILFGSSIGKVKDFTNHRSVSIAVSL